MSGGNKLNAHPEGRRIEWRQQVDRTSQGVDAHEGRTARGTREHTRALLTDGWGEREVAEREGGGRGVGRSGKRGGPRGRRTHRPRARHRVVVVEPQVRPLASHLFLLLILVLRLARITKLLAVAVGRERDAEALRRRAPLPAGLAVAAGPVLDIVVQIEELVRPVILAALAVELLRSRRLRGLVVGQDREQHVPEQPTAGALGGATATATGALTVARGPITLSVAVVVLAAVRALVPIRDGAIDLSLAWRRLARDRLQRVRVPARAALAAPLGPFARARLLLVEILV